MLTALKPLWPSSSTLCNPACHLKCDEGAYFAVVP